MMSNMIVLCCGFGEALALVFGWVMHLMAFERGQFFEGV